MFQIPCPHCGLRNVAEFRHTGESRLRPNPQTATPQEWRTYLYERRNPADWTTETWYHGFGCRRFVTVERHTVSNEVRPTPEPPGTSAASTTTSRTDTGAPDAGGAR